MNQSVDKSRLIRGSFQAEALLGGGAIGALLLDGGAGGGVADAAEELEANLLVGGAGTGVGDRIVASGVTFLDRLVL